MPLGTHTRRADKIALDAETLEALFDIPTRSRAWGVSITVYNDPTPGNNGKWVLTYGENSTDKSDNLNWVFEVNSNDALTAANAAQTSADQAQTTADDAQTSADQAQTAADLAQNAADAAQISADAAQTDVDSLQPAWNNSSTIGFASGWSSGTGNFGYRKVDGILQIRGFVSNAGGLCGDVMFSLPAGYIPTVARSVASSGAPFANSVVKLRVNTNGDVEVYEPGVAIGVSLSVNPIYVDISVPL